MARPGPGPAIRVTGLKPLTRALRQASTSTRLDRELGKTNARWINQTVVPEMKKRAPKGETGQLSASPRGSRSTRAAAILVGSEARVPYAGPINFGWPSRNIRAQEFIYSTIARTDTKLEDSYIKTLDKFLDKAFPEGRL